MEIDNSFEVWKKDGGAVEFDNPAVARKAALDFKKEYMVEEAEPVYSPTTGKYWIRFKLAKRKGDNQTTTKEG